MEYLDLTFGTPAENLAFDEELLDWHEKNGGSGVLRFWEPQQTFVVVGYGNSVTSEVNVEVCRNANVPIFRRCSGGGTILQTPGCINYALVLPAKGELESIPSANCHIMTRMAKALTTIAGEEVLVKGHTDLVIAGKKFAGNSQRRKKHYLLFHGCILINADLHVIAKCLKMPSRQPNYRDHRSHLDFLVNFECSAQYVKDALQQEWGALNHFQAVKNSSEIFIGRYQSEEWNYRFR